jgi:hypothetical protein
MATALTRAEAAAAREQRATERDQLQANLQELDASFGKRLLEGGSLTGTTKLRWGAAAAELASIWETLTGYTEVVRQAGEMLDSTRHPKSALLARVSELLTGPAVRVSGPLVPLAERKLPADATSDDRVTLATAVQRMTAAFSQITDVVGATERVWSEVTEQLDEIAAVLGPARQQADDVADAELSGALAAAEAELRRIRGRLTADPLSLWHDDGVDMTGADRLLRQARAAAARAGDVARLKQDADHQIAAAASKVATARAREADAARPVGEAQQQIAAGQLPALPAATAQLTSRLTGLDAMKAAARWQQLAAELAAIDHAAAAAAAQWQEAGGAAQALLDRRNELSGLLDAYRAKAAKQGAAENVELAALYQRARDLLRAAPCDLLTAGDAVRLYQRVVLGLSGGTP